MNKRILIDDNNLPQGLKGGGLRTVGGSAFAVVCEKTFPNLIADYSLWAYQLAECSALRSRESTGPKGRSICYRIDAQWSNKPGLKMIDRILRAAKCGALSLSEKSE